MDKFDSIVNLYTVQYEKHGNSPAAILSPKGRQELRFMAMDPFINRKNIRILDYGCGLAHLLEYLIASGTEFDYHGVDIVPSFIDANRLKYGSSNVQFELIRPDQDLSGDYDIVFSSGVFNLRSSEDIKKSKAYAFEKLSHLFTLTNGVLICDFASTFVDYQQEGAQHFNCGEIAQFCAEMLSRRFIIRHDLLPYEFTLIVYRDSVIKHPESVYETDINMRFQ